MSQALHRATVRCLYDPALLDRLRAGERLSELSEREHRWLLAVDPRAWRTDRYRRSRTLTTLLEEYPVAAALRGVTACEAFFSTPAFHRCVQERGRLALAFGRWLGPRAALELAIARSRRPEPGGGDLHTAPGVVPVSVPEGFLAWFVRARAEVLPLEQLVAGAHPATSPPSEGQEELLVTPGPDGPSIGGSSAALNGLLTASLPGRAREEAVEEAVALGCTREEAEELLDELVAEGLLAIRSSPRSRPS